MEANIPAGLPCHEMRLPAENIPHFELRIRQVPPYSVPSTHLRSSSVLRTPYLDSALYLELMAFGGLLSHANAIWASRGLWQNTSFVCLVLRTCVLRT